MGARTAVTTVLVTGANGFVGSTLCSRLGQSGYRVRCAVRRVADASKPLSGKIVAIGDIDEATEWGAALDGVDTVVHLAGRVHVLADDSANPLSAFRRVNTAGTKHLAHLAALTGVKRFVYVSTIKVNGERTVSVPFAAEDKPAPEDPYAISKWEAEQALHEIAADAGMEVVILRPPLVYGPGVKANFLSLLGSVARGIPLPLLSIDNRRSLVALDNLVDFIVRCIEHPAAVGEVFLVSDGEDLSTPELIRRIAAKMGRSSRLFPFSPGLLHFAARIIGRQAVVERLCGSLQVDISKTKHMLEWVPPVTVDQALEHTVDWYLRSRAVG